jgi:DNA-binding transcriptional MerR regulator
LAYNPHKQIEKVYYTIGEVADMFGVNPSLIRFWEREFEQLSPKKNGRGNRVFNRKDLELFHKIHHLVKDKGFTLEGAKKILREKRSEEVEEDVLSKLTHIRAELMALANRLEA